MMDDSTIATYWFLAEKSEEDTIGRYTRLTERHLRHSIASELYLAGFEDAAIHLTKTLDDLAPM